MFNLQLLGISIHAPSRERLATSSAVTPNSSISIHAPSRERLVLLYLIVLMVLFQSTLPRGSDAKQVLHLFFDWNFNPRSLAGATIKHFFGLLTTLFQSTLPRGSDHRPTGCPASLPYFNPRSLAGATSIPDHLVSPRHISIHAPSRERRCVPRQTPYR